MAIRTTLIIESAIDSGKVVVAQNKNHPLIEINFSNAEDTLLFVIDARQAESLAIWLQTAAMELRRREAAG